MKDKIIVGQKRTLATRKAILKAAVKAFSNHNYQEISLRDIALSAKVHHANIRYHFGSKEDLWVAALKVIFEDLKIISSQLEFKEGIDPKESLKEHIVRVIKNLIRNPGIQRFYESRSLARINENEILKPYMRLLYKSVVNEIKLMQQHGFGKGIGLEEFFFIYTAAINNRFLYADFHELLTGIAEYDDALINRHAEAVVTFLS